MAEPKVVHVKRDAHDVYVGRPSKWGNPFTLRTEADREIVVAQYRKYLEESPELQEQAKRELKGKVLACWCAPKACHADVLLEIANSE